MKKTIYFYIFLFTFIFINVYAESDDMYSDYQTSDYKNQNYNDYSKNNHNFSSIFPRLEGKILAEYYIDTLRGNQKINFNDKKTDSYLSLDSYFKLRFTKSFYFESNYKLKPVNKRIYNYNYFANNTNYFLEDSLNDFYGKQDHIKRKFHKGDYGLGVDVLKLGYTLSNADFSLGKINPTFAIAYNKSRFSGIYGTKFPSEYELTGKLGGSASALLPFGNITFNLFTDDTTGLSSTILKKVKRDKSKGGAGNDKRLDNFSITFNAKFKDLLLNFGYRLLNTDRKYNKFLKYNSFLTKEDIKENGWTGAFEYTLKLNYGIRIKPLVEYVYISNFDGMEKRKVHYITGFLPVIFENWHLIFSTTSKFDSERYYKKYNSNLSQISLGYKFDFGLMIDFAKVWNTEYKKAFAKMLDVNYDNEYFWGSLGNREKYKIKQNSYVFMISYVLDF